MFNTIAGMAKLSLALSMRFRQQDCSNRVIEKKKLIRAIPSLGFFSIEDRQIQDVVELNVSNDVPIALVDV